MHSQAIVIYPYNVKLEDVMYYYQEADKYQYEEVADERCEFVLELPENEIPQLLTDIKEYIIKHKDIYLEILQYRADHSVEQTKRKFELNDLSHVFRRYILFTDELSEYKKVKDLPVDHPKQIKFILEHHLDVMDDFLGFYIKGKGYGDFYNPYEIFDYYTMVDEMRFSQGLTFLVRENGRKSNSIYLNELDVEATIKNIEEVAFNWSTIIFCEKTPKNSRIYSTDNFRFSKDINNHCLVENLEDILHSIRIDTSHSYIYKVEVLDFHY